MRRFWSAVARGAVWVAVYAAGHPSQVIAIVNEAQALKAATNG